MHRVNIFVEDHCLWLAAARPWLRSPERLFTVADTHVVPVHAHLQRLAVNSGP